MMKKLMMTKKKKNIKMPYMNTDDISYSILLLQYVFLMLYEHI